MVLHLIKNRANFTFNIVMTSNPYEEKMEPSLRMLCTVTVPLTTAMSNVTVTY